MHAHLRKLLEAEERTALAVRSIESPTAFQAAARAASETPSRARKRRFSTTALRAALLSMLQATALKAEGVNRANDMAANAEGYARSCEILASAI